MVGARKRQIESITLAAQKCDGNTVATIMKYIDTLYLVMTARVVCKTIPHMQKLVAEGTVKILRSLSETENMIELAYDKYCRAGL